MCTLWLAVWQLPTLALRAALCLGGLLAVCFFLTASVLVTTRRGPVGSWRKGERRGKRKAMIMPGGHALSCRAPRARRHRQRRRNKQTGPSVGRSGAARRHAIVGSSSGCACLSLLVSAGGTAVGGSHALKAMLLLAELDAMRPGPWPHQGRKPKPIGARAAVSSAVIVVSPSESHRHRPGHCSQLSSPRGTRYETGAI